jgi:hypothetical protein
MPPYKTGTARYDIISTRVSERELKDLQRFADDRKISMSKALRMLFNVGLEYMANQECLLEIQQQNTRRI